MSMPRHAHTAALRLKMACASVAALARTSVLSRRTLSSLTFSKKRHQALTQPAPQPAPERRTERTERQQTKLFPKTNCSSQRSSSSRSCSSNNTTNRSTAWTQSRSSRTSTCAWSRIRIYRTSSNQTHDSWTQRGCKCKKGDLGSRNDLPRQQIF